MAHKPIVASSPETAEHGKLAAYVNGFVLSIVLTLLAYFATVQHLWSSRVLMAVLLLLAVAQFGVQLLLFMHVGQEAKPRWKRLTIVLMIFFALIVVLGSIWIIYNLNYRMTPDQINSYMQSQAGAGL